MAQSIDMLACRAKRMDATNPKNCTKDGARAVVLPSI